MVMVRVKKSHWWCRCMPFLIITLVASFVMTTLIPVSKFCGLRTSSQLQVNVKYAFLCDYICPLDLKMLFCQNSSMTAHSQRKQLLFVTWKFLFSIYFHILSRYSSIPKCSIHFHLIILHTIPHTDKVKKVCLKNLQIYSKQKTKIQHGL